MHPEWFEDYDKFSRYTCTWRKKKPDFKNSNRNFHNFKSSRKKRQASPRGAPIPEKLSKPENTASDSKNLKKTQNSAKKSDKHAISNCFSCTSFSHRLNYLTSYSHNRCSSSIPELKESSPPFCQVQTTKTDNISLNFNNKVPKIKVFSKRRKISFSTHKFHYTLNSLSPSNSNLCSRPNSYQNPYQNPYQKPYPTTSLNLRPKSRLNSRTKTPPKTPSKTPSNTPSKTPSKTRQKNSRSNLPSNLLKLISLFRLCSTYFISASSTQPAICELTNDFSSNNNTHKKLIFAEFNASSKSWVANDPEINEKLKSKTYSPKKLFESSLFIFNQEICARNMLFNPDNDCGCDSECEYEYLEPCPFYE